MKIVRIPNLEQTCKMQKVHKRFDSTAAMTNKQVDIFWTTNMCDILQIVMNTNKTSTACSIWWQKTYEKYSNEEICVFNFKHRNNTSRLLILTCDLLFLFSKPAIMRYNHLQIVLIRKESYLIFLFVTLLICNADISVKHIFFCVMSWRKFWLIINLTKTFKWHYLFAKKTLSMTSFLIKMGSNLG